VELLLHLLVPLVVPWGARILSGWMCHM